MYLKERSRGRNNKDLQVKEHFRVRIASAEIHVSEKATPEGVAFLMVHQRRFEHPTHGLGNRRSIP